MTGSPSGSGADRHLVDKAAAATRARRGATPVIRLLGDTVAAVWCVSGRGIDRLCHGRLTGISSCGRRAAVPVEPPSGGDAWGARGRRYRRSTVGTVAPGRSLHRFVRHLLRSSDGGGVRAPTATSLGGAGTGGGGHRRCRGNTEGTRATNGGGAGGAGGGSSALCLGTTSDDTRGPGFGWRWRGCRGRQQLGRL